MTPRRSNRHAVAAPAEAAPTDVSGHRERIGRNVIYLALGQVGTTALAIVLSAALGRTLGASDFGVYFLVSSMVTFGYVFVEWGQSALLVSDTARNPRHAGELLGTGLALRTLAAPLVLGPLLLVASVLDYPASTVWIVALFFVAALPTSMAQAYGTTFRGFERMDRDALLAVFSKSSILALVVAALASGGHLVAIGVCQFVAGILALGAAHLLYRRLNAPKLRATRASAYRLWVGGAGVVSLIAMQAAQPYIDAVVLSKLAPPEVVGWYGVARNILGTLLAPAVILASAMFPQLSRAAGSAARYGEEVRNALRPMLLLGALGSAGTYLFADFAVELIFGRSHFAPAVAILEAFSPGMFLLFVDVLLGSALIAAGKARAFAAVKLASVAVSTVLAIALVPWFQIRFGNGGIGVVVAFALSELVVFAGVMAIFPRRTLRRETALDAAKAVLAAAGTTLLVGSVPGLSPVAGIPLTVIAFLGMAYALRTVQRSDLELLRSLVRQRRASAVTDDGKGL